jgi:hypothetical protein
MSDRRLINKLFVLKKDYFWVLDKRVEPKFHRSTFDNCYRFADYDNKDFWPAKLVETILKYDRHNSNDPGDTYLASTEYYKFKHPNGEYSYCDARNDLIALEEFNSYARLNLIDA